MFFRRIRIIFYLSNTCFYQYEYSISRKGSFVILTLYTKGLITLQFNSNLYYFFKFLTESALEKSTKNHEKVQN